MTLHWPNRLPPTNLRGLIIEGISGAGKTTLLRSIIGHPAMAQREALSTLVLSEHHTQRVLEPTEQARGLTLPDHLALLEETVSYLEQRQTRLAETDWLARQRSQQKMCFVLERFHWTHVAHYAHMRWEQVENLDARMAALNTVVCLLTIDEAAIEQRLIASRGPDWQHYLSRWGETHEQIIAHYVDQQLQFLEMAQHSRLPTLVVDATTEDSAETATYLAQLLVQIDEIECKSDLT